ncbi:unnamed protein product [Durusdinium trenchii]|uniref:Uncharacterized protein n=1 Tax=Durusdinium trenchii TaxID=1381693 RepID=A0ABP0P542_9DINO
MALADAHTMVMLTPPTTPPQPLRLASAPAVSPTPRISLTQAALLEPTTLQAWNPLSSSRVGVPFMPKRSSEGARPRGAKPCRGDVPRDHAAGVCATADEACECRRATLQ